MPVPDAEIPSTSASPAARRRVACATHGLLHSMDQNRCPRCERPPYALDDESERTLLTNLRRVARSQRMNVARLLAFLVVTPLSVVVMALLTGKLTFSVIHAFLVVSGTASLAVPVERGLRKLLPRAVRAVDRELLEDGEKARLDVLVGP